jgi:hypothetical protein
MREAAIRSLHFRYRFRIAEFLTVQAIDCDNIAAVAGDQFQISVFRRIGIRRLPSAAHCHPRPPKWPAWLSVWMPAWIIVPSPSAVRGA